MVDLESFYNDVQNIFDKRGALEETVGKAAILDLVFLNMLFSKSQDKFKEYIGTETETKCSSQNPTEYSSANFEPTLGC